MGLKRNANGEIDIQVEADELPAGMPSALVGSPFEIVTDEDEGLSGTIPVTWLDFGDDATLPLADGEVNGFDKYITLMGSGDVEHTVTGAFTRFGANFTQFSCSPSAVGHVHLKWIAETSRWGVVLDTSNIASNWA